MQLALQGNPSFLVWTLTSRKTEHANSSVQEAAAHSNPTTIVAIVVVTAAIVVVAFLLALRNKVLALQRRFGKEYGSPDDNRIL